MINPMNNKTKLELFRYIFTSSDVVAHTQSVYYFRLLVKIGFKEIEVAYPSSADTEFEFVRSLIENGEVPDDVSLQVR